MCTTGALRFSQNDYCLFKNKDFSLGEIKDKLVYNADFFGIRGIENFGSAKGAVPIYSGLSIGVNKHGLICGDTNVKITDSKSQNYDCLVEIALKKGNTIASALLAIEDSLKFTPSWWGNIVLTDGLEFITAEIRGQELKVRRESHHIVITNHQPSFADEKSPIGESTSSQRLKSAKKRLDKACEMKDVFDLQKSHDYGKTGICNHTEIETIRAYLIACQAGQIKLFLTDGHPCRSDVPDGLPLFFGLDWTEEKALLLCNALPSCEWTGIGHS